VKRKALPGIVASVTGPKDTAAACETAKERVISAAVAYATAWKDWEAHGGYGPTSTERQTHRELVAAVEAIQEDRP
jgi:hypothetical protein